MKLPKAVQAAATRATDAHTAAYGNPREEAAPEATDKPLESEQAAQATPDQDQPKVEDANKATPTPEQNPKQSAEDTKDALYWQHRFDVLKGKYNTEVDALRKDLKAANEKVESLNAEIEKLKQSGAGDGNVMEQLHGLSPEEIEEFGPDLVKFVQRVVQSSVKPDSEVAARLERLEQERKAEEEERREAAKADFWSSLKASHPDFSEVNDDVEFHRFLMGPHPLDGRRYQDHLTEAQHHLNSRRVIAIFDAFKDAQANGAAPQKSPPEEQIEPNPARGAGEDDARAEDKPSFLRSEISQFYVDAGLGRYSEADRAAKEKQIFEAQRAGRIYPG